LEHRISVTRQARYYTAGDVARAHELWIVIHGYGQLAAAFLADFEPLASSTRAFVAPEALNRFYRETGNSGSHAHMKVGATWMTREDRDAEVVDYIAYLDAVERATRPSGARLGVLGFSQGVATQMRWLAARTRPIDRVIAWAGQVPPDVDLGALRGRLPAEGVDFALGTKDNVGDWVGMEAQRARFTDARIPTRVTLFEGGHRLDDATLRALIDR
jgi:dienelactone hydrolase